MFALAYESKLTLVLLVGMTALPVVSFILMLISGLTLRIEVIPDKDYVGKHQHIGIQVRVINRFIIPAAPMFITGTFHDADGSVMSGRRLVMGVAALKKCEYIFEGNIRFRGEYMLGIEHAEIYDLLRIFRFRIRSRPMCRIVVSPRRVILDENDALCTDDFDSSITKVSFMESGSFASVRKYEDGDLMKHVHWKLTAKHDELMVKQSEQNLGSSAVMVLDLHDFSADDEKNMKAADAAVETALALTRKIISDGRSAMNIYRTGGGRTDVCTAEKTEDYEKLISVYATIPITAPDAGAEALMPQAAEYLTGNEPLFIITTEMDKASMASALRTVGSSCGMIRVYLTGAKPSDPMLAEAEASGTEVFCVDPEDVSLSLRKSMTSAR